MTSVIIMGHGGYGTAIKRNLDMLVGHQEGFFFIDFNEKDDTETIREKLAYTLHGLGDSILFACDLAGGTPFREAAVLCTEHRTYAAVAGLNTAAYAEIVFNLDMDAHQLSEMAAEAARQSILVFHGEC